MKTSQFLSIAAALGGLAAGAAAQTAISAKSGLINHLQGTAFLDGAPVEVKATKFASVGKGSELRTGDGLAEVLLGPGVVLRMGEHSSFKMVSDELTNSRVELLSGSTIVERAGGEKDAAATIVCKDVAIELAKDGVYRVDSSPARLMVYDGEAKVRRDGQVQSVKKSKMLALDGVAVAEKFDNRTGDSLFRWSRRRAEYLAVANVSAAHSLSGMGYSPRGSQGWVFNPFLGTYTYLPMSGFYDSFWGYRYWSPATVYGAYYAAPRRSWSNPATGTGSAATRTGPVRTSAPPSGTSRSTAGPSAPATRSGGGRMTIPSVPAPSSGARRR